MTPGDFDEVNLQSMECTLDTLTYTCTATILQPVPLSLDGQWIAQVEQSGATTNSDEANIEVFSKLSMNLAYKQDLIHTHEMI